MKKQETRFNEICQLFEKEITNYHCLVGELKRQSSYLMTVSTDPLLQSLTSIEGLIQTIRGLKGEIQEALTRVTGLPSPDLKKVKAYQRTLNHLERWTAQINEQNRTFIQESLTCVRDLISLFIHPGAESAVYFRDGQKRSFGPLPYGFNRKVE